MRFGLKMIRIRGDFPIPPYMTCPAQAASLNRGRLIQTDPLPKSHVYGCGSDLNRPVADRSPINHACGAVPSRTNLTICTATGGRFPLCHSIDGGSDAKIHYFDGCGACARSVGCCGHRADSIARRGTPACANSKRHADCQRRRLPRLWAVLSAGHDPPLRTIPLLVRPLLLTLGPRRFALQEAVALGD
jgi:hypothetical protein